MRGERATPSATDHRTTASVIAAALGLLAAGIVYPDEPMIAPKCAMRLSVEVTPDVPNPSDGGFISSLLGNHAGYQLYLVRVVDDSHVDLQLQGPGTVESCEAVVDGMRNDGRIQSIETS